MDDVGFQLNINVTGLCILAHQPNYLHIVMPETPVPGDPPVPAHHAELTFDEKYSHSGQTGASLDHRSFVIRGDDSDTLCPSLPKSMLDLTDTFGARLPGDLVLPGATGVASLVRIETGQAAANIPGNLFCVQGGKPARHLSWLLTWTTYFTADMLTLDLISMLGDGCDETVPLFPDPRTRMIEITIRNMPGMGDPSTLQRYEPVHHFMAYYSLLKIDYPVPTFYAPVPSANSAPQARRLVNPHMTSNAFTCIPTCSQIG